MRTSWWLLLCCAFLLWVGNARVSAQPAASPATATRAVSTDEAHAALKRVLARGEFRQYDTSIKASKKSGQSAFATWMSKQLKALGKALRKAVKPLKELWAKIRETLSRWMPKIKGMPSKTETAMAKGLRYLVFILLGAVIAFVIGLIVVRVIAGRRERETTDNLDEVVADPSIRRKQEPSFWERSLQEAERLWQEGNQREALRILYRACLVLLDARGVLRYDESRANGEVLRELRRQGRGNVQQALTPIVRSFDRSWYGLLKVSGDEFSATLEKSRSFREAVLEARDA